MSSQAPNAPRATVRKITLGYGVLGLIALAGFFAPVGTERLAFSMVLMGGAFILMATGMIVREVGGQPPFSVVPGWPDRAVRIAALVVVVAFLAASHLGLEYRPGGA
ncbi:hypothetical protein F1654_11195 [Alkalicaulis satelles]|uniref:Uncharacterized protein n=1 Tax=Alkalicaulis satelles TaxID=2609175 RepID=A0A5M6ZDT1_9PROT|nr:hypothetical protein [Alkalicaulis satelles]KAA5802380.1 hypothetical protein F1654_11195 [Alkalicaulis satelles]